ncbi:hypothetical protein MBLNU230_g1326t1 [Neophaeotheca triangularis]
MATKQPSPTTYHTSNAAAWQLRPKRRPVVVSGAPYTPPPPGHLVIRVSALAINPIDWKLQETDLFKLPYPFIFGSDIAGTVHELGENVQGFQSGQRVIANANGSMARVASQGGFQRFVVVQQEAVCVLPRNMELAHGVVLPLAVSTAAAGLYQDGYLRLKYPSPDKSELCNNKDITSQDHNRVLLVWGGSSAVGSTTIQLARASGVVVFTTASKANFPYCQQLGASRCFDYHSEDVEDQIVEAMKSLTCVGAYDAVGAAAACARIVDRCEGKSIVVTTSGVPEGLPKSVRVNRIGANSIFDNDVGKHIWRDFLPRALESGVLVPAPPPLKIEDGQPDGLRLVQRAMDVQRKGVSARKVVVPGVAV